MTRISALTALTSADSGDTLPILDVSATTTKKITKTAFLSDIVDGTLIAAQAITPTKVDLSVANDAARTALTGFEGLTVYQEDTDAFYVYDGSAWRRQAQWEELGRTTLGVAGDTISITPIAARKNLVIIANLIDTGGAIAASMRFNNDSATNYAYQYSFSGAAWANSTSQAAHVIRPVPLAAGEAYACRIVANVWNPSTEFKVTEVTSTDAYGTDATTAVNFADFRGKWASTSQVTRVDVVNIGAGDFAIGSEAFILGRD